MLTNNYCVIVVQLNILLQMHVYTESRNKIIFKYQSVITVIYVYRNVKLYIFNEIDILELIKIEKIVYRDIGEHIVVINILQQIIRCCFKCFLQTIDNIIWTLLPKFPLTGNNGYQIHTLNFNSWRSRCNNNFYYKFQLKICVHPHVTQFWKISTLMQVLKSQKIFSSLFKI